MKLKIADTRAGKNGRCPKCKGTVTVPTASMPERAVTPDPASVAAPPTDRSLDRRLFDLPPEPPAPDNQNDEERLRELEAMAKLGLTPAPQNTGERQYAWPVDILLYPANTAGVGAIVILVGIPTLLALMVRFGGVFALVAGLPFIIIHMLIGIYGLWYFAECVYDSAKGGVRAPMAIDSVGDFTELRYRVLNLVAVYIIFLFPAGIYWTWTHRIDSIFWGLVAWAVVFFPMGLLAMVIQDSLSSLNPFSLLIAIFRTFFPYLGLLVLMAVSLCLRLLVSALGGRSFLGFFLDALGQGAATYLNLVTAHILGRFYWRYRDRLDWGI